MRLYQLFSFLVRLPVLIPVMIVGRTALVIANLCGRINYILFITMPGATVTEQKEEPATEPINS